MHILRLILVFFTRQGLYVNRKEPKLAKLNMFSEVSDHFRQLGYLGGVPAIYQTRQPGLG